MRLAVAGGHADSDSVVDRASKTQLLAALDEEDHGGADGCTESGCWGGPIRIFVLSSTSRGRLGSHSGGSVLIDATSRTLSLLY